MQLQKISSACYVAFTTSGHCLESSFCRFKSSTAALVYVQLRKQFHSCCVVAVCCLKKSADLSSFRSAAMSADAASEGPEKQLLIQQREKKRLRVIHGIKNSAAYQIYLLAKLNGTEDCGDGQKMSPPTTPVADGARSKRVWEDEAFNWRRKLREWSNRIQGDAA